ncbi:hypothetical protein [Flavobacterium granuli]|uniref:Uncharacterized protein n=1 Tax=Flavobacterium granuli TaxID=280093 RepID=A0ABU1S4S0_9FLAO|nr:hypothetical protein [Flavobacterium granuli]MDR6845625.1 hypothetical protein [Flavobacterium granuli]
MDELQYRLSKNQKNEIAQNLIDILQKDADIFDATVTFIYEWISTGRAGKRKAFFDVWDIVLKDYLPTTRPILFRTDRRVSKNGKIASFTGRLECVRRMSKGSGFLIICDTKEALEYDERLGNLGSYRRTFYPLVNVLIKARGSGRSGFSERFLDEFIGEDEYIMRINLDFSSSFKCMKNV